jgi:hypothetical protein
MATYTAYFHTDAKYASHDFDAESPEQALALARKLYADEPTKLWFEPYIETPVREIVIENDDLDELALWQDEDVRLLLAARDLLDALVSLEAQIEGACADIDLTEARAAIAKATGGAI